jgi:hypothetical protein
MKITLKKEPEERKSTEPTVTLYLMTNPLTNITGVYEITLDRICFDTGYNQEVVESVLKELKAEIERKDEAIRKAIPVLYCNKNGIGAIGKAKDILEQPLQGEEE